MLEYSLCLLLLGVRVSVGLMISPPGPVVWVAEHDSLVLTCSNVACYTCVTWTKDNSDVVDEGFTIKVSKQSPDNDLHVYDIVARKPKMTPSDEGNFTCESASQQETVYVNVIEIQVMHGNFIPSLPIMLKCRPMVATSTFRPENYVIRWSREGVDLDTVPDWRAKYVEHTGGTVLEIINTDLSDVGEYKCTVIINRGTSHPQRFVKMISVFSKPLIENETDVTLITVSVGHALELFCGAYGYPQPVVTWFKDSYSSIPITETGGVILTADGKLIVLHTKADDSGVYYCVSENSLDYIKRRFRVNVK